MAVETDMPQLQVVSKLLQIPLVQYAFNQTASIYKLVKGSNGLINWTLDSAEAFASCAVVPVAQKLQQPINLIDTTLCKGIDVLQEKVPIVNDPPAQMYEKTINYVSTSAAAERVSNMKNKGWEKANSVLTSTPVGSAALTGLDTCSNIADKCVDYLMPATEGEENPHPHPNAQCDDKVLHTVHTVGTLSAKIGRRVYRTIRPGRANSQPATDDEPSDHSSDEEN